MGAPFLARLLHEKWGFRNSYVRFRVVLLMACAFCRPEDLCRPRLDEYCRQSCIGPPAPKKRRHQDDNAESYTAIPDLKLEPERRPTPRRLGISKKAHPQLPAPVLRHFPIHHRRHILPGNQIPHLHHPMPISRQLPPPARLLRILLNRLILHSVHHKPHRPKPPRASPRRAQSFPAHADLSRSHHLLRDRFQNVMIHFERREF